MYKHIPECEESDDVTMSLEDISLVEQPEDGTTPVAVISANMIPTCTTTAIVRANIPSNTSTNVAHRQVCQFVTQSNARDNMSIHVSLATIPEIDVFLHGRGFRSIWQVGAIRALEQSALNIRHIHCYSFGAIVGVFTILGNSLEMQMKLYEEVGRLYQHKGMSLECIMFCILTIHLPPDAYSLCSNRVFIGRSSSIWSAFSYTEQSVFESNDDLIRCIIQSTTIPGITCSARRCVMGHLDGVVGYTIWGQPAEMAASRVPLLHLWPPDVFYRHIFSPSDKHIELRILQGIFDAQDYLSHGTHSQFTLSHATESEQCRQPGFFSRVRNWFSPRW